MITLTGVAIQSKIYESSASTVYRGIRVQDGQALVIKLLKQDYPSPQELTRYRQEYEITRSLNFDGVVKAYGQQNYQRTLVILLEDFGGESLERWMQQPDFCPMSLPIFLRVVMALTDTLSKIHAANIIHKDITPGNIVLNLETGVVKMIDFGIATRFNRVNPTFKSPHILEGTLAYMSPEQTGRMNRLLDYRTDFYSLGVTFYELLTGQLPFTTTDVLELVHCHIAKQPVPPHELNTTIPKPVSDMILKLMAKNAEDRYQSAWGIKADLENCANQLETRGQINPFQLGLHDIFEQFQISQKLYGREAEISTLLAAFERVARRDDAEEGRKGDRENGNIQHSSVPAFSEMLLVLGDAGIGKSALVQELYKPITEERGYFVSGKFDQFQRNIPYSAMVVALKKLVQQLLGEPDDQVQQWRSQLLNALGSNGQLIIDVIPEVELIIGPQQPVPEVGATEAQNRFNRVFRQFIRLFCSVEHPLVIFLDDLQWVDSATLRLIELMMTDAKTQHLFLIGAYRDNEVSLSHPLMMTLEELRKAGARINQISLTPLELNAIAQLIADTLHTDIITVHSLAELVLRKTSGNPFFVNEFLKTLYIENLLTFSPEQLCWQWNIPQIKVKNITDNVVELMLGKLKKLPTATQQVLRLAACIGADFDLSTLSIICDRSPNEIFSELLTAVQFGLIVPTSELDEQLLVQDYKFPHDRVQQAAYSLIDASQKQTVHLQVARNLLEKFRPEPRSDQLFEIVDHLNQGIELVTDPVERYEIARLNLIAGQKAKAAIAYNAAKEYLAIGRAILLESSWQTHYELTLELYLEATEVAFLCGNFDAVETWAEIVLQEAKTVLDTVKVYEVNIQADIAQVQLLNAIHTALQILQQLGISFPKDPSPSEIHSELDKIISRFSEKPISDLIYLPEMIEPEMLAAMRILSSITIAAYIATPDLMPLLVSKQVNLSMQYGNALVSPFAYATLGMVLCGRGNIEFGYQFGQLALRLLSRLNIHPLKARTLFIVNNCVIHWKKHLREIGQPLLEAYQVGLETGDLEFAAYCAHTYCFQFYASGKQLVELEHEMAIYGEAIHQLKQETILAWSKIYRQTVVNLIGLSQNPCLLIGEFSNEEKELTKHKAANNGIAIFDIYFNKLFLCYLFSDYAQAVKNSALGENLVSCTTATPLEPLYYLYDSLARLATYCESSVQVQEDIFERVVVNQKKMKHWAQYAPMNCLHRHHLVQAEMARVLGQLFEAEELYEQAIQGAKDNHYLHEEALAYELAAKHYLARGREKIAQTYIKEAHYCYERWGAMAKVNDLEIRYPQLFPQVSHPGHTSLSKAAKTTSSSSPLAFDLEAVLKASQTISSEMELNQLLHSLMKILIENAGAQTGYLILENSGKWMIEAACEVDASEQSYTTQVLESIPIATRLPESIIQYVIRTHQSIILNDAACEGNFIHEPSIQQNQTKSLLCIPLLNQNKLTGVLYLENQLAAGAFTLERSQVLHLLSTQAAIAIENARLYSKLRASESQMAQFLEAVPVGIGIVDAAGRPCYANQQAAQLLGKGIVPAATPDQLAEVYQLYLAGTDQPYPIENLPVMRALSGARTRIEDLEIRQPNVTIPVEGWGTPVFDEQGNTVYAIAAFQDITERKQAEKLLAEYNQILEQQVAERTLALEQEQAALRQSEATNQATISAIPDLLIQMSQDGTYLKVVRSSNFQPFNPQQLKAGANIHDILPLSTARTRMEYTQRALQTGELQVYEQKIVGDDRVYDNDQSKPLQLKVNLRCRLLLQTLLVAKARTAISNSAHAHNFERYGIS
ncbi:AAA family ATPase [Microcoleus sp. herbarium12]|uniref:AAA family ATPase n=1 Tax=Microcoleus sp. herbarium12 TaxID=3055437 RepID=UPI002FD68A1B